MLKVKLPSGMHAEAEWGRNLLPARVVNSTSCLFATRRSGRCHGHERETAIGMYACMRCMASTFFAVMDWLELT
jgi:hypothetical protein